MGTAYNASPNPAHICPSYSTMPVVKRFPDACLSFRRAHRVIACLRVGYLRGYASAFGRLSPQIHLRYDPDVNIIDNDELREKRSKLGRGEREMERHREGGTEKETLSLRGTSFFQRRRFLRL